MQDLSPEGLLILEDVARRHAVSLEAVVTMLRALMEGNGSQAQFNHPDLGGMGQWSQGGMIMVGDMFNQGLRHRVDTLCNELAGLLRDQQLLKVNAGSFQSQSQSGGGGVSLFVPGSRSSSSQRWPEELGIAASTGAQNDLRYACFPGSHRLAIQQGGRISVYDTGAHRIMGFSQQQSGLVARRLRKARRRPHGIIYATRTKLACPSLRIRLSDLIAVNSLAIVPP